MDAQSVAKDMDDVGRWINECIAEMDEDDKEAEAGKEVEANEKKAEAGREIEIAKRIENVFKRVAGDEANKAN